MRACGEVRESLSRAVLEAACGPIAFPNIRIGIGAIAVQIPLVPADILLIRVDVLLFGLPPLIPLFGAFNIPMLNGAVFLRLVVIPLDAVLSKLLLLFLQMAPVGANVAVVAADIAILLVNFVYLLLLGFGGRPADQTCADSQGGNYILDVGS